MMDSTAELQQLLTRAFKHHEAGQLEQANCLYQKILKVNPEQVDALQLSGILAHRYGRYEKAIELISRAIALQPKVAEFHHNIGVSYQALNNRIKAADHYQKAIEIKPDYADALNNLGTLQQEEGQISEALESFTKVLAVVPDSDYAHYNLASCYRMIGRFVQAKQHCNSALSINPVYVDARLMSAGFMLAETRFEEGWLAYEWRHYQNRNSSETQHLVPFPRWTGVKKNHVLVYPEQGLGDEVMFASCIPDLIESAESCVLLCASRLVNIFTRSFPQITVTPSPTGNDHTWINTLQQVDYRIPVGSLPRFFRKSLKSFPSRDHYLLADPDKKKHWHAKLAEIGTGVRVGISWRGGKDFVEQTIRSVPLDLWQDLFQLKNVLFINLQYGDHEDEITAFNTQGSHKLLTLEGIDALHELDNFAALICNLDLVISTDNSTVHLAGALGTPTWVLLAAGANWRWMEEGRQSLWYPSVRLFRSKAGALHDWDSVLHNVRCELEVFAAKIDSPRLAIQQTPPTPAIAIEQNRRTTIQGLAESTPRVLLLNDTSAWYHWGCSCTSLAIHRQLRNQGFAVSSIPIHLTTELSSLPQTIEDFEDQSVFDGFSTVNQALIHAITATDVLVINGEGTLHGVRNASLGLLYLAYVAKLRCFKVVHLINHSCYPNDSAEVSEDLAYFLYQKVYSELDFIAVREIVSAGLLKQLGVDATVSFDCLPLFIQQTDLAHVQNNDNTILIAGSVSWRNEAIPALGALIKTMRKKGYQIKFLFGAEAYPATDDFSFIKALHQHCGGEFALANTSSESEWLNLIAGAHLLISGRYHHTIAAAFLKTPFIVMESNTPKIDGLLQMLSLDTKVSSQDDHLNDCLVQQATKLLQNPESGLVNSEILAYLRDLSLRNFEGLVT